MRCFVVLETEVPNNDISESLDLVTGALDQAQLMLARTKSPCGYDIPVHFVYEGDMYRALLLL